MVIDEFDNGKHYFFGRKMFLTIFLGNSFQDVTFFLGPLCLTSADCLPQNGFYCSVPRRNERGYKRLASVRLFASAAKL